jgi:hypothetical protein
MEAHTTDDIARVCHEANVAYCHVLGDPALAGWDGLGDDYRESARAGVRFALEKKSSAAEQHAAWMAERLAQGWRHGTKLDRVAKIHPNLVPYDQLPPAQRRKDRLFRAIVHALADDV